jgi:phosphonate transport system ATP-binding protein
MAGVGSASASVSAPPPAAATLRGLICQAGGRSRLELDELCVQPGERIAVIGANGAGKSTLLRALSGFTRPAHGTLVVLGHALPGPHARMPGAGLRALRCEVGQVLQGLHLVQRLSAIENVLIGGLGRQRGWAAWRGWLRCPAQADVAEAEAALRAVGLLAKAGERADRLSGGERQRVAIARMLMQRPRLILADEPTASLDPLAAAEVCRLLARAAAGATLITVVHNPSLIPLLAERVLGLKAGRLAFDLPVAALDDRRLAALYGPVAQGVLPLCGAAGPAEPPVLSPSAARPQAAASP